MTQSPAVPDSSAPAARQWAALAASLALAVFLRLRQIGAEAPWCDEVLTLQCLPSPSLAAFLACAFTHDPRLALSPMYYVIEYLWSVPFGASTLSLRMLSVLPGVVVVVVMAAIGCVLAGARVAWRAAFLTACSLSLIHYSQEVRFYAWLLLFAALSWLALALALRPDSPGRRWCWAGHAAANVCLLATHAFAPLLMAGQAMGLLCVLGPRDRRVHGWMAGHAALVLAFGALVFLSGYDFGAHSEAFSDARPGWREVLVGLLIFTGARFSGESTPAYLPGGVGVEWGVLFLVLGASALGFLGAIRQGGAAKSRVQLLVCGVLVPFALLLVVSWGWRPVFFARYILPGALPLLLLAAMGWASVPPRRWRAAVSLGVVVVLSYPPGLIGRPFRPHYDAFAADVVQGPSCHKRVLALKTFNGLGAQYALGAYLPVGIEEGYGDLVARARREIRAGNQVWVVFHHWANVPGFAEAFRAEGMEVLERTYPGMPPLHAVHLRDPAAPPPDQYIE